MGYIIYGFGKIGQQLVQQLLAKGKNVNLIIDKTNSGGVFKDIKIIDPEDFNGKGWKSQTILIALQSKEACEEVYHQLEYRGAQNIRSYYMSEEDMSALCAEDSMLSNNCIHCAYVESCLLFQKRSMGVAGKTKVIDQINFILTMACSLNCKSCGALVPECKKEHYVGTMTFVEIKDYVNKISQAGYYIHQLMLAGGEPFLNRELQDIVKWLDDNPFIGYIKILSNGTIRIGDEMMITLKKCRKTRLWIDDYGEKLSITHRKTIEMNRINMDQNDVPYTWCDNSNGMWFDFGTYEFRGKDMGNYNNSHCYARNCTVVLPNGDFTWCSRAGMAAMLGYTQRFESNFLNLREDIEENKLDGVYKLKYLEGCEYCSGGTSQKYIEAGVQIQDGLKL